MSPTKIQSDATEALRNLADMQAPGALDQRIDCAADRVTRQAVDELAREFGGHGARSKAVRYLLQEGAKAVIAKRRRKA